MYLTHQEKEKMLLLLAASVAKQRKEKGLKLSYPEAVAYLSGHIIEGAREGKNVLNLIDECMQLLSPDDVMDGVPELFTDLQVEAMFEDGTKLVSMQNPISGGQSKLVPGAYDFAEGDIRLNGNRKRVTLKVVNNGDRPIQVGSHFHFYETNDFLSFDREVTKGCHLDIASGLSVRFEPGEEHEVTLVEYGGTKEVYGFSGAINSKL